MVRDLSHRWLRLTRLMLSYRLLQLRALLRSDLMVLLAGSARLATAVTPILPTIVTGIVRLSSMAPT